MGYCSNYFITIHTAEFEGDNGGLEITDVINCGEAV